MKRSILLAAGFATALTTAASAQDPLAMPVIARQGIMAVLAMNLGVLGGMARGKTEYDAEAAQTAANAIYGVSMINMGPLLPDDSDSMSRDGTRADPMIWDDMAGYAAEWAKVQTAAPLLAADAGKGKDAMVAALQGVQSTCRSCHKAYRTPE